MKPPNNTLKGIPPNNTLKGIICCGWQMGGRRDSMLPGIAYHARRSCCPQAIGCILLLLDQGGRHRGRGGVLAGLISGLLSKLKGPEGQPHILQGIMRQWGRH